MTKIIAVIGAGYGDEGKGAITDYFAHRYDNSIVVRFNGGSQAGHTVLTPCGKRHVFSHIGSGSFSNTDTMLSEHFICNPLIFKGEMAEFTLKHGDAARVYVHHNCLVTTPVDMIINQILEIRRGGDRHGSVGLGINETIERSLINEFKLTVEDLRQGEKHRNAIIDNIQANWIDLRLPKIDNPCERECKLLRTLLSEQLWFDFRLAIDHFLYYSTILDGYYFDGYDTIIFEGAQGLQLDQTYGVFPHVTRSNTGVKNIIEILDHVDNIESINIHYITRAYVTRHGHGPLFGEQELPYNIVDETNVPHEFQGSIRYAPLSFNILYDAIFADYDYIKSAKAHISSKAKAKLVVTCTDQIQEIGLCFDYMNNDTPSHIATKRSGHEYLSILLDHAHFASYGPTRADVVELAEPVIQIVD